MTSGTTILSDPICWDHSCALGPQLCYTGTIVVLHWDHSYYTTIVHIYIYHTNNITLVYYHGAILYTLYYYYSMWGWYHTILYSNIGWVGTIVLLYYYLCIGTIVVQYYIGIPPWRLYTYTNHTYILYKGVGGTIVYYIYIYWGQTIVGFILHWYIVMEGIYLY